MGRTARELHVMTGSFVAGADLSDAQFHVVVLDPAADGQIVLSDDDLGGLGILLNKPKLGQDASVIMLGMSKGIANGALANAIELASSATGKLKAAQAGDLVIGRSNTTVAAADAIVEIILTGSYYKHV